MAVIVVAVDFVATMYLKTCCIVAVIVLLLVIVAVIVVGCCCNDGSLSVYTEVRTSKLSLMIWVCLKMTHTPDSIYSHCKREMTISQWMDCGSLIFSWLMVCQEQLEVHLRIFLPSTEAFDWVSSQLRNLYHSLPNR